MGKGRLMSVCFNINCHDCEVSLWIAQGGSCFYYGDKDIMDNLGKFLFKHRGHKLSFDDDDQFDWYKEFEDAGVKLGEDK